MSEKNNSTPSHDPEFNGIQSFIEDYAVASYTDSDGRLAYLLQWMCSRGTGGWIVTFDNGNLYWSTHGYEIPINLDKSPSVAIYPTRERAEKALARLIRNPRHAEERTGGEVIPWCDREWYLIPLPKYMKMLEGKHVSGSPRQ